MRYPLKIDLRTPANFRAFKAFAKVVGNDERAAEVVFHAGSATLGLRDPQGGEDPWLGRSPVARDPQDPQQEVKRLSDALSRKHQIAVELVEKLDLAQETIADLESLANGRADEISALMAQLSEPRLSGEVDEVAQEPPRPRQRSLPGADAAQEPEA